MKARQIGLVAAVVLIVNNAAPALAEQELAAPALAKKSGCFECHGVEKGVEKKVTGPAFHDIAARYKNVDGARIALIEKIKNGSKGNWTEVSHGVPMPPYSPRLSDAEIQRLVDWLLGL